MGTLLVIFTLCGTPDSVLMMDAQGVAYGPVQGAPERAIQRLGALLTNPDAKKEVIPLETLSGGVCV
jgi:hypothetical protein